MKNSNCIIITQKEWLNWLAFGYLRISPSRISYFDNTESSFDILMSYSVDNTLDEEDAYLIASLVNDYSREELHVKRTPFSDYIYIQAVQGFYSLSIKGRDLLENEMEQSHSILHYDSKIENLWIEWKKNQLKLRSNDKGNKFLEILGYPRFEVEPEIDNETLFSQTLKNYTRNHLIEDLKDLSNNNSFAWFFTNYQFSKTDENIYGHYKKLRKSSENIEFKNLSNTYITQNSKYLAKENGYLVDHPSFIAEKIFFDRVSKSEDYFLATSFLVHYYNLLDNDLEIDLRLLETDLAFLDEIYSTKDISQLIAYFIGRRLNEVYLSYLYIAKNIDEEKPAMFDPNFFSNLKNENLTSCNIDQAQLQDTINKVNFIAEEIQLAYKIEVNKVQDSEIGSDAIADRDSDLNQSIQSQAPIIDSGNSETNNNPTENLDTPSNTTDNNSTQPHSEAQNSVDSEESGDSTNGIDDSHRPTQSQPTIIDNSNIKTNNILSKKKEDIPSSETISSSVEANSEAKNSFDSEDSQDNTNSLATKNEDFNENNHNLELSLNTELNRSDKEDPIYISDKHEYITETDSKSDNSHLKKSNQPDSDYFKDLALAIYSELSSKEQKTASLFIKKFIEQVGDFDKNKLKSRPHVDFFRRFGELVGDIETYQDINYDDFKSILDRRFKPVAEEQVELEL